ncbi:MAG: hypothetical protein R3E01_15675 [Pirellulaceae bacterium]|nr:hypothetical protein [Planctomycetales bacterium]
MNAAVNKFLDGEINYETELFGTRRTAAGGKAKSSRPTHGRTRGRAPQKFNGIHRRRQKKVNW